MSRLALVVAFIGIVATSARADSVVQLVLVDADTDLDLLVLSPGEIVDLTSLPTTNLNVRAETDPPLVGSVRFDLNGTIGFRIENTAPYAMAGDTAGDYAAWSPGVGVQNVVATPFTGPSATGTAGTPLGITFSLVDGTGGGSIDAPIANAGPDVFPVLPASTATVVGTVQAGGSPIASTEWSQVSGPAVTMTGATTPTLGLTGLAPQAIYRFQLIVTDTAGRVATDQVVVASIPPGVPAASLTGPFERWHRVTLTFDGPSLTETSSSNPFLDYRLEVSFTRNGRSVLVPGFFAADGNAAETSATSGSKWCVHFRPDELGTWNYTALFRTGGQVAVSTLGSGSPVAGVNGSTGSFTIGQSSATAPDFRARGPLRYVDGHYLRFEGDGGHFLKGGANSPENFLAYDEFDGTYDRDGSFLHEYAPHVGDWSSGDPTWQGSRGMGIIGAINYLGDQGMNVIYFLTMNVGGDGDDIWPWIDFDERQRFDVSKLAQWNIVFEHMTRRGLVLHVVTQERENDQLLDGGALGLERRLYYRELIARFAHHPAIIWNMGEENTNTTPELISFSAAIRALDPYDHPITVHTYPNEQDDVWAPLLGLPTFEIASLQCTLADTASLTEEWRSRSALANRPWVVCADEQNPATWGVRPDSIDPEHDDVRIEALWPNLLEGGGGVEWYFGYNYDDSDIDCEDWRSRQNMWDQTRHALEFLQDYAPFWEMDPAPDLTSRDDDHCLAKMGEVYVIHQDSGSANSLTLPAGEYDVAWFDPRNGGSLQAGTVATVDGPGSVSLGSSPGAPSEDWVILVRANSAPPPPTDPDFVRGDVSQDGAVNLVDALLQLDVIFNGTPNDCLKTLDFGDDGAVDVADAVGLLTYLFIAAATPPQPPFGGGCGPDPTPDPVPCDSFGCP